MSPSSPIHPGQILRNNYARPRQLPCAEAGQGLVEYSLILVLIAIVIIIILTIIGPAIPKIAVALLQAIIDAPRYLQIALLVVLLIPLAFWLRRLAPQVPKVLGLDVRQIELANKTYQDTETSITAALLKKGRAQLKEFGVSRGLWLLAARKYVEQHKEASLYYDEPSRAIVSRYAAQLVTFNQLWAQLTPLTANAEPLDAVFSLLAERLSGQLTPVAQDIFKDKAQLYLLNLPDWNSPLPSRMPILVWLVEQAVQGQEVEQLRQLLAGLGLTQRIALLVDLAGDSYARRETVRAAVAQLRQVFAYDFVLLGREEIARVLMARGSRDALARQILPQVDLMSISPFVLTGPAPDNIFFGREPELRKIAESAAPTSQALIGGRRFGKSSVMLRLHRVRLPAAGFRTIYHDCSATATYEAFTSAIIRDWRPEPPAEAPLTFNDLALSLSQNQAALTAKPLVLLLDEADKLVPADRLDDWRLFKLLRSLASSGLAQFVLSGERTLREALRDSTSPLFNFANEMLLGPLDFRSVDELVTRPMKQLEIELAYDVTNRIYDFTSGHPNVVQRLCRRLIERLNETGARRITADDVSAVINDPAFQRDDFLSTYWEAATPLEKLTSLLMAENQALQTLSAIRQALADRCGLQPKAREVDEALQRLVDLRSILKRTPEGYTFAIRAFPRVVKGTMTLQDMLEVLIEDYREQSE